MASSRQQRFFSLRRRQSLHRLTPSLSGMAYEFSPVHQINEAWEEIIYFWEVLADSEEYNSINRSKFAGSSAGLALWLSSLIR